MGKKKGKGQGPAPRSSSNSLSEPGNTSANTPASSVLPTGVPSNVAQTGTPAVPVSAAPSPAAVVSSPTSGKILPTSLPVVCKPNAVPATPSSPKTQDFPSVVASVPVLNQALASQKTASPATNSPIGSMANTTHQEAHITGKGVLATAANVPYTPVKLADLGILKSSKEQILPSPKEESLKKEETIPIQKVSTASSQLDSKAKEIERNTLLAQKPVDERKGSPKSPKSQQKSSPKEAKKGQTTEKIPTFAETIVEKIDSQLKSLSSSSGGTQLKPDRKGQNKEEKNTQETPTAEQLLPDLTKFVQQKLQEDTKNKSGKQPLEDLMQLAAHVNIMESTESGTKAMQKNKDATATSVALKLPEKTVGKNIKSDLESISLDVAQFNPTDTLASLSPKPALAIDTLLAKNVKPQDVTKELTGKKVVSDNVKKSEEYVKEAATSPKAPPKPNNKQQGNKEVSEKNTGSSQQEKQSKTPKDVQKPDQFSKPTSSVDPKIDFKPDEFPIFKKDSIASEAYKNIAPQAIKLSVSQDLKAADPQQNNGIFATATQKNEENKAKDLKTSQKPELPKKPSGLKPSKQTKEFGKNVKNDDAEQLIPGIVWEVSPKGSEPSFTQQASAKAGSIQTTNTAIDISKGLGDIFSSAAQNLPSTKGDLIPEKVILSPEVPSLNPTGPIFTKPSTATPVVEPEKSPVIAAKATIELPKSTIPIKNEETVDSKNKKENTKKEENIAKNKAVPSKKDKNAQKTASVEESLKDVKAIEKELNKDDTKDTKLEKDATKNQEKSTKSSPKQEKSQGKQINIVQDKGVKTLPAEEEKKLIDLLTKSEILKTEKAADKEEKTEKGDSKKKPKEDSTVTAVAFDKKVDTKDQKTSDNGQLKDSKSSGKPAQDKTSDKNSKKDKNNAKEVKTAKEEIDHKPVQTKQDTNLPAKDAKPPKTKENEGKDIVASKDSKENPELKAKETEKNKKEQGKGAKSQDVKLVVEKPETPLPEGAPVKEDKKTSNKQQKKNQDDNKSQVKDATEKKTAEKPVTKEKPAKPEKAAEFEKSKEKVETKKTEKAAPTPLKPKAEKPKGENKEKTVNEVKTAISEMKKDVCINEDKDVDKDSVNGNTDEATAAKKKRRRKKKNKKPAEGISLDEAQVKSKQPEKNEPIDQKKPQENISNKTQANPEGFKVEKSLPKPLSKSEVLPLEVLAPSHEISSASEPADKKPNDKDQGFNTTQTKKKKNNKKKQDSGTGNDVATEQTGAKNDSAGQKKTPFDSRLSKMTVNPLAHHLSNCCCICKATSGNNQMPLQTCTACSLACYCNREHQVQHWKEHKQFCNYIASTLSSDRPYFFTPAENLSPDERRNFRLSELQICQKALNRQLTPLESALILHPRACYTCYKPAFQNVCLGCYCINYCCIDHLPLNHKEWCSTLLIKLLFIQSQAEHGSSGVSVPRPAKIYYPLNSNMKEYLESLDFEPPKNMDKKLYISHVSELATYPLTLLHALQLLAKQGATNPLDYEHLVIHVVGAEDVYECCQILKWKYFFVNLLQNLKTLHLVFIGCELSIEDERVHVEGRLVYEFHAKMTYLDYCKKCYIKPSIVCAFNSGLYRNTGFKGTDSWGPSLYPMLSMNPGAPVLLTAYTHMESNLDLQRLKDIFLNSLQVVQLSLKNPYASIFPNHNLVSEQECPVAFRNFYLTIVRHT